MEYHTDFEGELKFTKSLNVSELAHLNSILGREWGEHPEWEGGEGLSYIGLELLKDFTGIRWDGLDRWDGTENASDMAKKVNLVIREMKNICPEFGLDGQMNAQGEGVGDLWRLVIEDGTARIETPLTGNKIKCPHCGKGFLSFTCND